MRSSGHAPASIAAWAWIRRRLVRLSRTINHAETETESQPRSAAILEASLRFRSGVPSSSLTSTMSVFSSTTRMERRPGMPDEDVDDAALAIDRERHFRGQDPGRPCLAEHPGNGLVQARVRPVAQPVQIAFTPPRDEIDPDIHRGRHGADGVGRERVDVTAFYARDRRLRCARRPGKVT